MEAEKMIAKDAARREEDRNADDAIDAIINLIFIEARRRNRNNPEAETHGVLSDISKRVENIMLGEKL